MNFRLQLNIMNLHKFLAIYGFRFSKQEHVYFIKVGVNTICVMT
jgi:hypothetical protein